MQKSSNRWRFRLVLLTLAGLALVASARPLAHAWERWERQRWHQKVLAAYGRLAHDDSPPALDLTEERERQGEPDDPTIRRLYHLAYWGVPDSRSSAQLLSAAQREAQRWAPAQQQQLTAVSGQSWESLGPTDARFQSNGGLYKGIDSGRLAAVRVDPRDRNIVYVASAWGGVWKTYNFTDAAPAWIPITDTIGALDVGAFEIDPTNPDVLYLALGDALEFTTAGGALYKSTDAGGTWSLLTASLTAAYPASAGGRTEAATTIRDLAIDRNDPQKILVATDVGLFRSVDGGQSFALAPLPTDAAGNVTLESTTWTVQYLGAAGSASQWVVSGLNACATGKAPPGFGDGLPPGDASCARGTLGDIWRSSDGGGTWTSLRATGKLPTAAMLANTEFGRTALAAGNPSNPDTTVVYAQVASADDGNSSQLGVFKSTDGGRTFTVLAGARPSTLLGNRTTDSSCRDMNVAHDQAWYNLAIAVDPTNSNHVLLGGNLCGVRSIDGGATWSNVAHWLPGTGGGNVQGGGTLPYVHADWHTVSFSTVGGQLLAFAGTDGGLFSSQNVFSAATGQASVWNYVNNRGIASHLFYGLASGDPTTGDDQVVFGGLQDNGTRFRDLDPTLGSSTTFNQVLGGDGIGTALVRGPAGVGNVYWASFPSSRVYCVATTPTTCTQADTNWIDSPLNLATAADPDPFMMHYAVIDGDATGAMLTATTYNLFKIYYNGTTLSSAKLTPAVFKPPLDPPATQAALRGFAVSPFAYKDAAATSFRLYGVVLSQGYFAVGVDKGGATSWTLSGVRLGVGATKDKQLGNGTSIAFPAAAAHFKAGAPDGGVFLVGSTAPRMYDDQTPVPDSVGRIFLTTDGGKSYQPFHGNGTSDLPNVPVQAIVFDPSDTTDNTIFVGNDLGVYQTTDMGKTWKRYGVGLPMARVTEIRIARNSGLMRVSTYGRGLWEIYPNKTAAPGVRGDGDWDRNLQIDFLDLGAAASRLGTTPETASQPYFDWHLDQVGAANSIGEEDLGAVLTKFGSHP